MSEDHRGAGDTSEEMIVVGIVYPSSLVDAGNDPGAPEERGNGILSP